MHSRKNLQEAQDFRRKAHITLNQLKDHLSSARSDLYFQLRVAVISGFAENHCLRSGRDFDLLSNILLDMDETYQRSGAIGTSDFL